MIEFLLEYGMWGMNAKPLKGALWRAKFYDRASGRHYAGSADCPFEAIAWALYEREERIATGTHSMTRSPIITPAQALARLRRVQSTPIKELIERSSIGAGLRNIRESGIDAELADLEREMGGRRR